MKKFMIWLTLAMLLLTGFALAERATDTDLTTTTDLEAPAEEILPLEGVIEEIIEPTYNEETGLLESATILMNTQTHGLVEVHFSTDSLLEGAEDLSVGDYIYVQYNGMMTRSIPGQVSAEKISAWRLTGKVTEVTEDGFMLNTQENGDVWVHAAEDLLSLVQAEGEVTVYFNGVMTLSLPGQINAAWIVTPVAA